MKFILFVVLALAVLAVTSCVNVDLGQASKDWSGVGKSFADSYKGGGKPPAGSQAPQQMKTVPQGQ
ncbi:MAG: hypothetical protein NTX71_11055 [Candidatus Aureabacteria bacterium]|nr:hypothetical protein [Candidatus Auribacterota bacterium]